jgi:hypothetical protein
MQTVSGGSRRDTPLRSTIRTHLHEALDELLDAGDALEGAEASAVDAAFVTLLRLARARKATP